jgi:predicted ribosomally synthesized peptide with SipW-like signal peptide
MRKILGLTVAALLVMGLVGGGTWAYFSDTEEVTLNGFSAGTLEVSVDAEANWTSGVSFDTQKPGAYVDMVITSAGTIAGDLYLTIDTLAEADGAELSEFTGAEWEMTAAQLASMIYVTGQDTNGTNAVSAWITTWDANSDTMLSLNEMVTAAAGAGLAEQSLPAGQNMTLRFSLGHSFAGGTGNGGAMQDSDTWATYSGDYDIITASEPWNVPQADGATVTINIELRQQ